MIPDTDEDTGDTDDPLRLDPLVAWRAKQMVKAGYPVAEALELAERRDVDLHHACDLLTVRHCPVDQAILILR